MKKIFSIALSLMLLALSVKSQQIFIGKGKIEFEKKINLHKVIEEDSWLENLKDKIPQFRTDYFNLYFNDGKTLFEKEKDNDQKNVNLFYGGDRSLDDIIYTDIQHQTFTKKENVFEQTFLLNDSIRKIDWRITNDTRDIAGFECRKAIGRILDSVYIIAFYADQITVSGGPFSFCNLPGMILGIAIPRLNLTCFATKIELTEPPTSKLIPPTGKKLKTTNYKDLETSIKNAVGNWGDEGRRYLINFML